MLDAIDRIRAACDLSIRRACGFAVLAIFTAMIGLSYHPLLAIRFGAALMSAMIAVLLVKGWRAPHRPYRRAEVWLILEKQHDLPETRAQGIIGAILRERYLWHATVTAAVALPMWGIGAVLGTIGRGPLPG